MNVRTVDGVGESVAEHLEAAGHDDLLELREVDKNDLTDIDRVGPRLAKRLQAASTAALKEQQEGKQGGRIGNNNAVGNSGGGAPNGNQNARSHSLWSDSDGYYNDSSDEAQELMNDWTHTLLDRLRTVNYEPDLIDKELCKGIAIDIHKVADMNGYLEGDLTYVHQFFQNDQLMQEPKENPLLKECRQHHESIINRMRMLGMLNDPESQKADAMQSADIVLSRARGDQEHTVDVPEHPSEGSE